MNHLKTSLFLLILIFYGINTIEAQETLSSSGCDIMGDNGSVCYTVGQLVYSNLTGATGSIYEGVQQAFEVMVISSNEELKNKTLDLKVFPNPTNKELWLHINESTISGFSFQLFNTEGKIIQENKLINSINKISMDDLVSEVYFLKVLKENQAVKTFKIIKH